MAKVKHIQCNELPAQLEPNAIYFVRDKQKIVQTDALGIPVEYGGVKRVDLVGTEINWKKEVEYIKTLTENTTFTDVNLPQNDETALIILHLTGDFAITFPSYWQHKGGSYDGSKWNMIVADCLNGNSGDEKINYTILTDE